MADTITALTELLGQGALIGAHLVSVHSAATYLAAVDPQTGTVQERRFENVNPGLYLQLPSGFTTGAYRNSYGRASAYTGWTFETADRRFALTVGGVTGYLYGPAVRPLIVPSVRFDLSVLDAPGWSARLSLAAKHPRDSTAAAALHLSLERQL